MSPSRKKKLSSLIPTEDSGEALAFCQILKKVTSKLTSESSLKDVADRLADSLAAQAKTPELSLVIPVYNEEENIELLCRLIAETLDPLELEYEVIMVDDGSTDGTLLLLQSLLEKFPALVIVEFTRNFGHQAAIGAGLDHARGKAVLVMDADLQDPPEALPKLIEHWREGYEIVYAIRTQRKESWLMRIAYASFYRLLKLIANIEIPVDTGDFCIIDRKVVDLLRGMPERNRFIRGLRSWGGFRQLGIKVPRNARFSGKPKYTLAHLFNLALDGFVSFSFVPLRLISLIGIFVSFGSMLLALFYVVKKIFVGLEPPGFATIVTMISFFSGLLLITIGIIGEYVGRIFEEVKRRPPYVVRKVTSGQSSCES